MTVREQPSSLTPPAGDPALLALDAFVGIYANPRQLDGDAIEVGLFRAWLMGASALGLRPGKAPPAGALVAQGGDAVRAALILFIRAYANADGLAEDELEEALFDAALAGAVALDLPAPRPSPLRRAR